MGEAGRLLVSVDFTWVFLVDLKERAAAGAPIGLTMRDLEAKSDSPIGVRKGVKIAYGTGRWAVTPGLRIRPGEFT
jgi:hypothetical protein